MSDDLEAEAVIDGLRGWMTGDKAWWQMKDALTHVAVVVIDPNSYWDGKPAIMCRESSFTVIEPIYAWNYELTARRS